MDKNIILKIIEAGNAAPSGGNSQPWKFRVKDNAIEVIALPEKDHPVLNYKNRGTYIAHGALLENMEIAANYFGYEMNYQIFPEKDLSLKITFEKSNKSIQDNNELYKFIFERHSNRKPFHKEKLEENIKSYLLDSLNDVKHNRVDFVFIEDQEKIKILADNLAMDVLINFGNYKMHELLFKEILFREKDQFNKGGLYIRTMEVPLIGVFIFKLLKNKKILNFFKEKGLINQLYKNSAKTAASCSLIGGIFVNDNDEDFIYAGKLMENIWLRATKLGLGFHLITGIPFLWQGINFQKNDIFSIEEKDIINNAYLNAVKSFDFQNRNKILAFNFRIGKGEKPSAVSYKRPPEIEWIN